MKVDPQQAAKFFPTMKDAFSNVQKDLPCPKCWTSGKMTPVEFNQGRGARGLCTECCKNSNILIMIGILEGPDSAILQVLDPGSVLQWTDYVSQHLSDITSNRDHIHANVLAKYSFVFVMAKQHSA